MICGHGLESGVFRLLNIEGGHRRPILLGFDRMMGGLTCSFLGLRVSLIYPMHISNSEDERREELGTHSSIQFQDY
jgi:hypothetical protein